jgi:hypothetical protein
MKEILVFAWRVVRYWKPLRTFWITAAGLLALTTGIDVGTAGLQSVDWIGILSGSATTAVLNFVVLMAGGDSFWSEPKGNTEVIKGKPQVNTTEAPVAEAPKAEIASAYVVVQPEVDGPKHRASN